MYLLLPGFRYDLLIPINAYFLDVEQERESLERDRRHQEQEINSLRAQLAKSATVTADLEQIRQDLKKSENQRDQLSDHIQVG